MRAFLAALLLGLCVSAGAQTAYTDYGAFMEAVGRFPAWNAIGFDMQATGTTVSGYGPLSIYASGLASDGVTNVGIPLAVTGDYPTVSGTRGFGPLVGGQFLSGNSDRVIFRFSEPVNAFGVRIVGNPSPTGVPAVPFWRLRANISEEFVAFSSTNPVSSLGGGNDVYFIGVVSPGKAFDGVELRSDNDLAAVFSFNCDDITYASLPKVVSIPEAKMVDGEEIAILDAVVTRVHKGRFNVATDLPLAGIAVLGECPVDPNVRVSLWGKVVQTEDDERVIELGNVLSAEGGANAPGPFLMQSRHIGGMTDTGFQKGTDVSLGLNNVGLDVTLCGHVTAVGDEWITLDDGCGVLSGMLDFDGQPAKGVKIVGGFDPGSHKTGEYLVVTGSVSLHVVNSKRMPLIRVASVMDIRGVEFKQ